VRAIAMQELVVVVVLAVGAWAEGFFFVEIVVRVRGEGVFGLVFDGNGCSGVGGAGKGAVFVVIY